MKMRKLFLSFTATLRGLDTGEVTPLDLKRGLFYFGCTRKHAMFPGADKETNEVNWFFKNKQQAANRHGLLRQFLQKAEREGRAAYRQKGKLNNFEELNKLLMANCYKPIICWLDYSYPGVESRVEAEKLPLKVFC